MFTLQFASIEQLCHPRFGRRKLGCVREIDYRTKPGSDAWHERHPPRVQKLSASRRAHLLRTHPWVQIELQKRGYSGDEYREVPPAEWLDILLTFEARDRKRGIVR